jgi:hypothetical protein
VSRKRMMNERGEVRKCLQYRLTQILDKKFTTTSHTCRQFVLSANGGRRNYRMASAGSLPSSVLFPPKARWGLRDYSVVRIFGEACKCSWYWSKSRECVCPLWVPTEVGHINIEKDWSICYAFLSTPFLRRIELEPHDPISAALSNCDLVTVNLQEAPGILQGTEATSKTKPGGDRRRKLTQAPTHPKSSPPPASSKRQRKAALQLGSEEDICGHLLEATSGAKGKKGRFFRKALRRAVELQYDQSKASSRVEAALGGKYEIKNSEGGRFLESRDATAIVVRFHKGSGSRSWHEEVVDKLTEVEVKAVIASILPDEEGRGMLQPHGMAGCSPRIFWNLVRLTGQGSIPLALATLFPTADLSFLEVRDRKLSKKALDNLAQERLQNAPFLEEDNFPPNDSEDLAEGPGEGGELSSGRTSTLPAAEMARNAALARLEAASSAQVQSSEGNRALAEIVGDEHVAAVTAAGIISVAALADTNPSDMAGFLQVAEEECRQWVSDAQEISLDAMMHELIGNEAVLQALSDTRCSTPRDVVTMSRFPDVMVSCLRQQLGEGRWASLEALITQEAVSGWFRGAQKMLASTPWLDMWVTKMDGA